MMPNVELCSCQRAILTAAASGCCREVERRRRASSRVGPWPRLLNDRRLLATCWLLCSVQPFLSFLARSSTACLAKSKRDIPPTAAETGRLMLGDVSTTNTTIMGGEWSPCLPFDETIVAGSGPVKFAAGLECDVGAVMSRDVGQV
jgi:hypothetical protein